jgi:hypothetical protein
MRADRTADVPMARFWANYRNSDVAAIVSPR